MSVSAYLGYQSQRDRDLAATVHSGAAAARAFVPTIQNELRMTAAVVTAPTPANTTALAEARGRTDAIMTLVGQATGDVTRNAPPQYAAAVGRLQASLAALPTLRKRVDAGKGSMVDVAAVYSTVIRRASDTVQDGLTPGARIPAVASEEFRATQLLYLAAAMGQANALARTAYFDDGMNEIEYQEFVKQIGYPAELAALTPKLPPDEQRQVQTLTTGVSWSRQLSVEQAVLNAPVSMGAVPTGAASAGSGSPGAGVNGAGVNGTSGNRTTANRSGSVVAAVGELRRHARLPVDQVSWDVAADAVGTDLLDLGLAHLNYASSLADQQASEQLTQAWITGATLVLFALIVTLLTTRSSGVLVNRLRRLRLETIALAENKLPDIVARLQSGSPVDVDTEVAPLDFGSDEIGRVADAFNHAQKTAIAAAVRSAEIRSGFRSVFLNIAHRSQVIVHQQLKVLDAAERAEEDPEQVALLFELDHLATRARRNAENLVILGGAQPGRQWRRPVPLHQVVRSAISEAQDYARVSIGALPALTLDGAAVADVVHLLAELVDNATMFSPPGSRVEVRGNLVGHGVAIEIEDQGIGVPPDQLDRLNELLREAPDYHVMAIRDEPRLGLFVVAQIAARRGIRVTLMPSPAYGGTQAVVLIPSPLMEASGWSPDDVEVPRELTMGELSVSNGLMSERVALEEAATGARSKAAEGPASAPAPAGGPSASAAASSPESVSASGAASASGGASGDSRPVLPRRARQTHLAAQLRSDPPFERAEAGLDPGPDPQLTDPEVARRRAAAIQRGTQLGRMGGPDAQ